MSDLLAVYREHLGEWLPQLIDAAGNTVRMTVLAFILAFIVGLALALVRLSPLAPLRWFASGYIEVMRGIPTLAVLFLIYFGLADFGIIFDAFPAAVLGFGLSGAAYMAEIFRALRVPVIPISAAESTIDQLRELFGRKLAAQ